MDADKALNAVRSHWQVESMHWMLDMTFREDEPRIRKKQGPLMFNLIRKITMVMFKIVLLQWGLDKRRLFAPLIDTNNAYFICPASKKGLGSSRIISSRFLSSFKNQPLCPAPYVIMMRLP